MHRFSALLLGLLLWSSGHAASDYLQDARAYLERGEREAAVIQLKNLLREEPDNAAGRLLMGRIQTEAGNWAAAEKELSLALEHGAPRAEVIPLLAETLVSLAQWDRARQILLLDWMPDMPAQERRAALLGSVHLARRELEDAENAFYRSIEIRPNEMAKLGLALVAQARGKPEEAIKELAMITGDSREARRARLIRAELLRNLGRNQESFDLFSVIIREEPENLAARLSRAQAAIDIRQLEAAREDTALLLDKLPSQPQVRLVAGLLALLENRLDEANEHAQMVLQQVPENPQALLIAGAAAFYGGQMEKAIPILEQVVERVPGHRLANQMLAEALLRERKPELVIRRLQPLLEKGVDDPVIKALLGNALLMRGELEEGSRLLDEAAELLPPSDKLNTQRALTRLLSGQSDDALSLLDNQEQSLQADAVRVAALLRKGAIQEAIDLVSKRRQSADPRSATPYAMILAVLYQRQGDMTRATQTLEEAADADPDNPSPLLLQARLALTGGDADRAERSLNTVLERDADNPDALLGLASVAAIRNDRQSAQKWLDRAIAAHPDDIRPVRRLTELLLASGHSDRAVTIAQRFQINHPQRPDATLLYATALARTGDRRRAIDLLEPLLQQAPGQRAVALTLASLHKEEGDPERALDIIAPLVSREKVPGQASLLKAELLLATRDYTGAAELLTQLASHHPANPAVKRLRLLHAVATEKRQDALRLERDLYPNQRDPALLQLMIQRRLRSEGPRATHRFLESHLKRFPDDNFALLQAASLALQLGLTDLAVERYETLKERIPNNALVWNNLAWLYEQRGDDRSLAHAREANRLAPTSGDIQDTLGWILLRRGKKEEALRLLQAAAARLPDNPEVRLHLADALWQNGRAGEAEALLAPLLEADNRFRTEAEALKTAWQQKQP